MKAVVGIDIGSSAIKAILAPIEENRTLSVEVGIFHAPLCSRVVGTTASHFEEDPRVIREQVFEMLRRVCTHAKKADLEMEAIACTGQMHGGLIVDSNLEPLTNFITWQDKRGNEIAASEKSYAEELRDKMPDDPTGVSIHTGFLLTTLDWLKEHHRIPTGAAHVLGIYDWLTSVLVGRAVTDISSAAAWAMFDPIEKQWREDWIDSLGIPLLLLPEITEPGAFLGTIDNATARAIGLPTDIRIHASIGDTQAAYLGSECQKNELLLNFGTGSQSMWETNRARASVGTDIRYLYHDRYIACAPTLAGGEAYRILARFFQDVIATFTEKEVSLPEILSMMDDVALNSDSNGPTIDPIFRGSKFRRNDERGSIAGITSDNFFAAQMTRSLVQGMIEEVATPYFARGETHHTGVVGAGSGLRLNPALCSIAEQRFGVPLRHARFTEAAAAGAAILTQIE